MERIADEVAGAIKMLDLSGVLVEGERKFVVVHERHEHDPEEQQSDERNAQRNAAPDQDARQADAKTKLARCIIHLEPLSFDEHTDLLAKYQV